MKCKKFLPVLLVAMLSVLCVHAQDRNRISGKVVNANGSTPIPNASVFISSTSKGTVTDAEGNFAINNIPAGTYDLIISSIGYTTVVYSFSADKLPLQLKVEMTAKPSVLDAVTVEPFEQNGWERWGKYFTDNFIGTMDASKNCKIKNYEVIHFRYSKKNGTLTAIADEPLIIENNALGYRIQYQLEDFVADFKEHSVFFLGYTLFEDMASDRRRLPKRWADGRKKAYLGSMMHFMRSLYNGYIAEEGFETRRLFKEPNLEKQRVKQIMQHRVRERTLESRGQKTVTMTNIMGDSSDYYQRIMAQPDMKDILASWTLTADSLVSVTSDSTKMLFFNDYLYITFKKGREELSYLQSQGQSSRPAWYPRSTIYLRGGNPVVIEKNGFYYPPQEVFSYGYWGWNEKIAQLLPLDFKYEIQ
ncbi:MAG: carboxypeptidase-like regulatory domain-containing protein [Chitinophagaceae bacterium]